MSAMRSQIFSPPTWATGVVLGKDRFSCRYEAKSLTAFVSVDAEFQFLIL